jgi:hypothetical protein
VEELVEPCSDESVAAFDFVIEEGEGEVAVHGFDPEGESAEFDGEWIEVNAVDAAFDDVPFEDGFESWFEAGVIGFAGDHFLSECCDVFWVLLGWSEEADDGPIADVGDAAVVVDGGVEGIGEIAE